jgi:NAD(P)-dependent dehydrogenase (short-subunit alcohol dehydrogenase family)
MSASQRVLLVTGASSGIGRATAVRAARYGDHLVLAARGLTALKEVADECSLAGAASVQVVPTDIGDDEAVRALVEHALEAHGRLDAVVNAAGVVAYGRTEDVPAEVFEGVLRTNLIGSVNIARHTLPVLRRQDHGTLVLVGSVIGHIGVPSMSPYVLSKWGVRALARQLELENRDRPGVHIGYVAPGGVDTPIYEQAANFAGFAGRPPPPVSPPERTAKQILARTDHRHRRSQLTVANDVIRFGFTALPWVYDAIVAPAFRVAAMDLTKPIPAGSGNVLESRPGNALHGAQGSAFVGIARNLKALARPGKARP